MTVRGGAARLAMQPIVSKISRKHVSDVQHLDEPARVLVGGLEKEDTLTIASFEAGPTLGTGTFGRVFVAKHKASVRFCFFALLVSVYLRRLYACLDP